MGLLLGSLGLTAAPLPVPPFPAEGGGVEAWTLKDVPARVLEPGAVTVTQLTVPELSEKERGLPGAWHGVASVDLYGVTGEVPGRVRVELFDPPTNEVIASGMATVAGSAKRSAWTVISSSAQGNESAMRAFDGDAETIWHSDYDNKANPLPQWIGMEFGAPVSMPGFKYVPRAAGNNGVPRA
jgi:hypothetical protein